MASSTSLPGARVGKYRLLAHVATGGMGSVYKARDEELGRIVALKVLSPELSQNPTLLERFRREARHASRLSHRNIVTMFECGQDQDQHYIAMEFIDGMDLGEYIRRKVRLDPQEARRILLQACKAVDHAFSMGITHRDLKPSNFLLATDEGHCRVKMTDLGLARMVNEEEFRVTRAGTTVGTVDYLSPEQSRDSAAADVRSDIYSLGCTFYHMLAGHPPFSEGGLGERIYKHLSVAPPDVRDFNPDVPPGMWAVLQRMLAKDPDDRYQTPAELIRALKSMHEAPISPSRQAARTDQALLATPTDSPPPEAAPESSSELPETPAAPPPRRRWRRPPRAGQSPEQTELLAVSPEQRHAAAGQFERVTELLKSGGDPKYPLQLLLSCCKLDPTNLLYRKTLREVGRSVPHGKKGGWFGNLTRYPARSRIRASRLAGDHRKVLEDGEELLTQTPGDLPTQLEMAESAEALRLYDLSAWMLEEARHDSPDDLAVLRTLARVYESQRRFGEALTLWEKVARLDPSDPAVSRKICDLAANDTIARGNYRG